MFDQMSTWQLYQMYSYFLLCHNMQDKNVYLGALIHLQNIYIVQDKKAFVDILKNIAKIQRTNGSDFVVLKDRWLDPVHLLFIAAGVQPRTKKKKWKRKR